MRSRRLTAIGVALACAALTVTTLTTAEARPRQDRPSYPGHIELPVGFLPEGIAIGKAPIAYLGSRADGDIYAADLRTGEGKVISQGPGTASVGLKLSRHGTLFVAGGPAGDGRMVSVKSGKILRTFAFADPADGPTFVNDVALTRSAAWFTDSLRAELYRVPLRHHGRAAKPSFTKLMLGGDWEQKPGFNANGIVATPDRRALLVVQSETGYLFRVNTRTGHAQRVDLGGTLLLNGDGMLLKGRTLYVVQNQQNLVAVLRLNARGTRGTLVKTLTSGDFDVPTTVAAYKGRLYLPNARFTVADPASADYWITRIEP